MAKEKKITPRELLGSDKDNKLKDAARLYRAALELDAEGRKVTADSVIASLHDAGGKALPSSESTRLAAIVAGEHSAGSMEDHVARIGKRQKTRDIEVLQWAAWTLICFNIGAFFGMYAFARVTQTLGRRPTFAIFFTFALAATVLAFGRMEVMPRDLWMVALMGAAQLSVFGGYAIYFPELFPTRLRSTGTSFCYNVGRYLAAVGPFSLILLKPALFKQSAATKCGPSAGPA